MDFDENDYTNLGLAVISWYQVSGYSIGNHDLQSTFTCSVSDGLRNLVGS